MSEIVPEAYCDAMFVAAYTPKSLLPLSILEMHLFSYLACILALFRGKAIGDWGYSYAVTTEGFPFSAQFESCRKTLVLSGLIVSDDNDLLYPRRTELTAELETVLGLGPWAERRPLIQAATECALALPLGAIRYAIGQTPGMALAVQLRQRRRLMDPDDVSLLYHEYEIVNSVLGSDSADVLSPAVIWLSARIFRKEEVEVGTL